MSDAKALYTRLQKETAERDLINKNLDSLREKERKSRAYHGDAVIARAIIQTAAEQTQKQMETQMSSIVSSALVGIFPDPYEFVVRFVQKRNKTECLLLFRRDGEEFTPVDSSGGGALDIASFALRVAFWCIGSTRNSIILDEPFRFLSANLQSKAGELLKRLSKELNIQFIVVTHIKELLPYGDRVLSIEKGVLTNGE